MCSIIASFNTEKFKELVDLNQFRGSFSHSITYTGDGGVFSLKDFGPFPKDILENLNDNLFKIGHVQAPTGGMIKDRSRIHPCFTGNSFLWHNGILTDNCIQRLQDELHVTTSFDTKLLSMILERKGVQVLNEIEGLFSCIWYHEGQYYMFRSKHGKLYVDENLNISSERFNGGKCINYDTVYQLDLSNKKLIEVEKFKTLKFNYIIAGEL